MTIRNILTIGVFDLFHVGHLRYLQFAAQQGERLVVAVCTDEICFNIKSKYPVIPQAQRLEIIRGLGCVSEAQLQPSTTEHAPSAAAWIAQWKINHVVAGGGWDGSERWKRMVAALDNFGITVTFAPATEGLSTTQIIANIQQGIGPAKA